MLMIPCFNCNYNSQALTKLFVTRVHTCTSGFLISFEVWAKLAQKWLVCAPLGINLEPINKELMLLVRI